MPVSLSCPLKSPASPVTVTFWASCNGTLTVTWPTAVEKLEIAGAVPEKISGWVPATV